MSPRPVALEALRERYDAELTAWVPKATYRAIFADRLSDAWHMARSIAASAALEASLPPVDVASRAAADAIRADAWGERFTTAGDARMVEQLAAASAMIEAACYGAAL